MSEQQAPHQVASRWQSSSVAETRALGQRIGALVPPGLLIALSGNLGAGKTAITQGIAAGLGITATVTSPTFIFVNEYATPAGYTLIHIDSYRLGDEPDAAAREAFTFGLDEILSRPDAIVVIEWAERLRDLLPDDHLQIALHYTDEQPDSRAITVTAHGPISAALLAALPASLA
jgi:tRNA threonylcarbamoyladenosine biosynthesis protein TsaE